MRIARQAYVDFGRGNHPAGLSLSDCFAYALAKATGEPLLFKATTSSGPTSDRIEPRAPNPIVFTFAGVGARHGAPSVAALRVLDTSI